jgi:SM-20-related protein
MLNIDAFRQTPLKRDPYEYVVVPGFLSEEALALVNRDFPDVPGPGSHPPAVLGIQPGFRSLLDELDADPFRQAVEEKFSIDLESRPTMFTVRGYCRASDGKIHRDAESKMITVLLYLNEAGWLSDGGRLRILRGQSDMEDFVEEVEPSGGTLLVFRRSDHSWHGHRSFEGPRRAIQMNWVTGAGTVRMEQFRHSLSTIRKRIGL